MGKGKVVTIRVDENFFKRFERDRQNEQAKLRSKFGRMFNLTQSNFTAMLATKNFSFEFPKKKPRRRTKKKR